MEWKVIGKDMKEEAHIGIVVERINSLQENVTELRDTMRESVREMSQAIQLLVRLEEKQINLSEANQELRRCVEKQEEELKAFREKVDSRLDVLEKEAPLTNQVRTWVLAAIWAVLAAAGTALLKFIGVF